MTTHLLKIWPANFDLLQSGERKCDVRDTSGRRFTVGDEVVYYRFDPATEPEDWAPVSENGAPLSASEMASKLWDEPLPDWAVYRITDVHFTAGPLEIIGIYVPTGFPGDPPPASLIRFYALAVLSLERVA
jgi:hypothetical protein